MFEWDDHQLLAEFARSESGDAFSVLVNRYINLVYSTAHRFTSNAHHAEEITQAVFIILARKAGSLGPGVVLSGWLYQTARLTAANFMKGEFRRRRREQEACMQSTVNESDPAAWEQIGPLLDEAMGGLGETDRSAVVLRFFENRTAAEVAAQLNVSEAAAHKRTSRALEKLRRFFTRRGVVLTAGIIAGAVSANSVQAAPASLAATISLTAVKGSAAAGSTLALVKGALKVMAWSKAKTTLVAGLVLISATVISTVAVMAIKTARSANYPSIQGAWSGALQLTQANAQLRVVFNIAKTNQIYSATLDSLDQGLAGIQVTKISYDYPAIHLETKSIGGIFDGRLDAGAGVISGRWKQGPVNLPLALKHSDRAEAAAPILAADEYAPRPGSDVQGLWKGTLTVKGIPLRLLFKIAEGAKGEVRVLMDSVDQGAKNIAASAADYQSPALNVEFSGIKASFEGEITTSHQEVAGTWTQGGESYPLTMKRVDPKAEAAGEIVKNFEHDGENDLPGHWKGTLNVKDIKLGLVFDIAKLDTGKLDCTLISVDQGGAKIPATIISWAAPDLRVEWKALGAMFYGKLQNGKLTGTWRQGPVTAPLNLDRAAAL